MSRPFKTVLKEFQAKNGLNNAQMANILGISERMYSYYESGQYPGAEKKVAKFLQKLSEYEKKGAVSDPIRKSGAGMPLTQNDEAVNPEVLRRLDEIDKWRQEINVDLALIKRLLTDK